MRRIPMPFSQLGYIESLSHPQLYRFVWRRSTRTDGVGESRLELPLSWDFGRTLMRTGVRPFRLRPCIRPIPQRSSTQRAKASQSAEVPDNDDNDMTFHDVSASQTTKRCVIFLEIDRRDVNLTNHVLNWNYAPTGITRDSPT